MLKEKAVTVIPSASATNRGSPFLNKLINVGMVDKIPRINMIIAQGPPSISMMLLRRKELLKWIFEW